MALRRTLTLAKESFFTSWLRNASGYRKYGLHREDLIMEELPGVKEALRRLPEDVVNARYFRIKRATTLSIGHTYLDPAERMTPEEDAKVYLKPVLDQVLKELEDAKKF